MTMFASTQALYDRAAALGEWAEASVIGELRRGYLWQSRFYWLMDGEPVSMAMDEVERAEGEDLNAGLV